MALPPNFLEELRARTPLAGLIGRRVKLARSGRNLKGCCPFHGERTPSFHVYEDHYHCFGCGVHGDAISFVMQSQGLDFIEAVKQLAAEAGLEVPAASPDQAESARQAAGLAEALAAAEAEFIRRLAAPEGAAARAYLKARGIGADAITRFGLGWSGAGRGGLAAALAPQGIGPALLAEAGLLRGADPAAEFFYQRLMFPIRDRRGRTISFGGRTLGDGQPKYLNGPETPVFSKRRALYGLDLARAGLRQGAKLVVVEGYMDVIALHQGGFTGAVAPLGTALSEDHLEALWRLSPAPILCFDGDAAGSRAAARTAELALPHLGPERSLLIASLPGTEDPDSLLRGQGSAAMQAVLDAARPLHVVLFDLLREQGVADTPEGKAAFRARLEAAAARIGDKGLAGEYRRALLDRLFASQRRGAKVPARRMVRPVPQAPVADAERARILTAILLHHPDLVADVEEAWYGLDLPPAYANLREQISAWAAATEALDSAGLIAHLKLSGHTTQLDQVLAAKDYPLPACADVAAMPVEAEAGWWHMFGLINRGQLEAELVTAQRDFAQRADQASQRRLVALATARAALHQDVSETDGQA